ncbi:hypothetical protein BDF20DRAFT_855291 [Mycotypha africana]|uniref:uncharacterized protein n=1 Tax=Mycotypha africana TaxID=64632 RepID=UPI00230072E4|nr:uncharacterized protein BDF20DRAFT_855291 [Mycotypha africana]KAI8988362.1 hypothetical protein BDF20DRAFT_855291 [Mycotypha africana]
MLKRRKNGISLHGLYSTCVCSYPLYKYIHIYIYIYIYMYVCMCMCMCAYRSHVLPVPSLRSSRPQFWNDILGLLSPLPTTYSSFFWRYILLKITFVSLELEEKERREPIT